MTVMVLGGSDDEHAVAVLDKLRSRGADAELLDSRWFPQKLSVAYDPQHGMGSLRLSSGRRLALDEIDSIYWRSYHGVLPPDLPDPEQAFIAGNDARSLFESLLIRLPAKWVNGWQAYQLHQAKPAALAVVAGLGVDVPDTILSNDADAVREFAARYPRCIFKPVQGGAHTRRVTAQHLSDDNLRNLAYAPVTLQEEIPGTNIRAFVAGERVLACEVRTEAIDFRDDEDADIRVHRLPPSMEETSRRIAGALHLVWTGIDFRRTPEGRYVFLEANPSPMFLGFESRTRLPLLDSLVAVLLES